MGDEESQAGHSKRDRPSEYRDKVEVEDEDNDDNDKTPLMSSTQPPPPPSPRGDIEMNPITNSKQAEGNLLDLEPSVSSVPSTLPPTEVPTETPLDLSTDSSTVVLDRGAGRTAAPVVPSLSPSSSSQILNQQRRAVPSATDMLEMESSPVGSPKRMKDLTATSQSTASRDRLIAKALADFVPTRLAAPINAGPTGGVSINANNNSTGNGSGSGSGGSNKKQATSNGQKQSGQRRSSS